MWKTRFMRMNRALVLLGGLLLTMTACDEFLTVDNLISADREDATASPEDLQAFIAGSFYPSMIDALHGDEDATAAFPLQSPVFTATMQAQNTLLQYFDHAAEPRAVHDNGVVVSVGNGPQGPRDVWATVHEVNSVAHDGIFALDANDVVIEEEGVDVTARARAFAKLMQGWSWGYLGLIFDRAHVVPDDVAIPSDPDALLQVTVETLKPYQEVIAASLAALDEAIAIAQANPSIVQYPSISESNLWFGSPTPVSNAQFIQLANTLAARFLVLSARNPTDRAAVDWNAVLDYTAAGLTTDLEFQLNTSGRESRFIEHFTNDPDGERNYRWDYRAIGHADQSGAFQTWISSSLDDRDRFEIVTPDLRITSGTSTSDGTYTEYRPDDNGFIPARGTYAYSAYQWRRHALEQGITDELDPGQDQGTIVLVSVAENDLLRAEALARTSDPGGAATLANNTRSAAGLADATSTGAPETGGVCVPRTDAGDCGGILAVIRYERMIELGMQDLTYSYADARGWGMLADGTPFHYPVPGNALDQYGMDNYTYGGVGREGSATYAPTP